MKNGRRISVRVVPRSSRESVRWQDGTAVVRVNVPAEAGRANERVIELMAEDLRVAKSRIEIVHGSTSRHKQLLVRS